MLEVTPEFCKSVVEFTRDANTQLLAVKQAEEAAQAQIPATIEALKSAGVITADRTDVAQTKLASHSETLNVVVKLAAYIKSLSDNKDATKEAKAVKSATNDDAPYTLGKAAVTKSTNSTNGLKESDRVFLRGFNLLSE